MSTDDTGATKLRRRDAIAAAGTLGLGAGAVALLKSGGSGDAAVITAKRAARKAGGQCVLTPELTEGPYAGGDYSGFGETAGEPTFLRGQQRTDANGKATFKTIYPGWYMGRAVHIHLKVHVGGDAVHTGQLFFSDALSAKVFAKRPYSTRGQPDTSNDADGIYPGRESEARVRKSKDGKGYVGKATLVVDA